MTPLESVTATLDDMSDLPVGRGNLDLRFSANPESMGVSAIYAHRVNESLLLFAEAETLFGDISRWSATAGLRMRF